MRWLAAVTMAAALAGCGRRTPSVEDAWVRLPAVPGRPAAAYLTIAGGEKGATLVAITSPAAGRAELHESMANGMRAIADVAVPARGTLTFAPSGRHVMLFDLDGAARAGGTVGLRVAFADGTAVTTDAKVVAAVDPAPVR